MRVALLLFLFVIDLSPVFGGTLTQSALNGALRDLRNDRTLYNCRDAMDLLMEHREEIASRLVTEFYQTDSQGREAIFQILFETKSFVPDEKFIRAVLRRMHHYGSPDWNFPTHGSGDAAAEYIVKQTLKFGAMFVDELHFDDPFTQCAITCALNKNHVLEQYKPFFTDAILGRLAAHLRDDEHPGNAQQAGLIFFLLGDRGLPVLRKVAAGREEQSRGVAQAFIAYFEKRVGRRDLATQLDYWISLGEQDLKAAVFMSADAGPPENHSAISRLPL
jgi:hypothetical protein